MKSFILFLKKNAFFFLACSCLAGYWLVNHLIAALQHCPLETIVLFKVPHFARSGSVIILLSFIMYFFGLLIVFILPGWFFIPWIKNSKNFSDQLAMAFLLSLFITTSLTTIFKCITNSALNHVNFSFLMTALLIVQLIFHRIRPMHQGKEERDSCVNKNIIFSIIVFILLLCIFISVYPTQILDTTTYNISMTRNHILSIPLGEQTDLLERFGLAKSLYNHLIPFWDLEYTNAFGYVFVDPPLCAFIQSFLFLIGGETLAGLILFSFILLTLLFVYIATNNNNFSRMNVVASAFVFFMFFLFFLNRYDEFIYTIPLFSFFTTMALIFLLQKKEHLFLYFSIAGTLTKFYGIFFTALGLLIFYMLYNEKPDREACKRLFWQYCAFVACLILFIVSVGLLNGQLEVYYQTFILEHFSRFDFLSTLGQRYPGLYDPMPALNLQTRLILLRKCFIVSGFLFPGIFFFAKTREEKFYTYFALIYFGLLCVSLYHMDRYLIPIVPLTLVVLNSKLSHWVTK